MEDIILKLPNYIICTVIKKIITIYNNKIHNNSNKKKNNIQRTKKFNKNIFWETEMIE